MNRLLLLIGLSMLFASSGRALEVKGIKTDTSFRIKAPNGCGVIRSWQGDDYDMDGTRRNEPHRGLDIVAPKGTPVVAAASGRVIYRDTQIAGGNALLIWHGSDLFGNRVISYYVHMNEFNVAKDQLVRRGEVIGTVGNTGSNLPRSRTPHLHFEVLIYPSDSPHFFFGWLRGFTTVSPNYFIFPLPAANAESQRPTFGPWQDGADYGDAEGRFTGFTFPLLCSEERIGVSSRQP
jgi:murein DD-endopeptidase MepM/ murein hydrolase activator NlpD